MITTSITTPSAEVISHHIFANVLLNNASNQKSLHAAISFAPGDLICNFHAGITQAYATYLTVQTAANRHITLMPEFLQYINHSCNPNAFFNTTTMELIALKAIEQGDEFTFFYPSTEWFMAEPFNCLCGEANCIGVIKGAKEINSYTLSQYRLTDFIQSKIDQLKD